MHMGPQPPTRHISTAASHMNNNNKTHRHTASNPESPAPIVDTHHSPPPDTAINHTAHSLATPARITNIGGSIAGPPALKTPRPITATRLTSARAPKSPSAPSAAGDIGTRLRWAPRARTGSGDCLARLPISRRRGPDGSRR
ncbi:hypothetical protein N7523_006528 [Penicillium sp. IBT 18751x]|nr:hypothetical protein N7523_006528 [Penicillium sp. IBT 18751x]